MRYRKKPVVIEAVRVYEIRDAITFAGINNVGFDEEFPEAFSEWEVWDELHETWVSFQVGDWIIRGVKGEFYPCVNDVFEATYEPVDEATTT